MRAIHWNGPPGTDSIEEFFLLLKSPGDWLQFPICIESRAEAKPPIPPMTWLQWAIAGIERDSAIKAIQQMFRTHLHQLIDQPSMLERWKLYRFDHVSFRVIFPLPIPLCSALPNSFLISLSAMQRSASEVEGMWQLCPHFDHFRVLLEAYHLPKRQANKRRMHVYEGVSQTYWMPSPAPAYSIIIAQFAFSVKNNDDNKKRIKLCMRRKRNGNENVNGKETALNKAKGDWESEQK